MREGKGSFTSRAVMFFRALAVRAEIPIFQDTIAEQLLNARGRRILNRPRTYRIMERLFRRRPKLKKFLAALLLRARFAEDELVRAMDREGVRQYVILGAGWDTFAWRRTDLMDRLRLFELDHPDTQAAKRARLAERGLVAHPNQVFVPIDFTTQSLSERLLAEGGASGEALRGSFRRIVGWLQAPLDPMHELARALQAQPQCDVAWSLVADSATHVYEAFGRARESAQRLWADEQGR